MEVKRDIRNLQPIKGLLILLLSGILLVGSFLQAAAATNTQTASDGQAIFDAKCKACHTIGGGTLVGPDLDGVMQLRQRDWLQRWIAAPDKMLAEGDPIATELLAEFNNLPMPNLALTDADVESLLVFLESGAPQAVAVTTLPTGDPAKGEALFTGAARLQNGGPACLSCHSTTAVAALGGGTLGPDLTNVASRYGESGLAAALDGLPFPTMQGTFTARPLTEGEIGDLFAYFMQVDQETAQGVDGTFVWYGLAGFVIFILLSHFIWSKRLSGVRIPLVGR